MKLQLNSSKLSKSNNKFLKRITLIILLADLMGCSVMDLPNANWGSVDQADLYIHHANTVMRNTKSVNNNIHSDATEPAKFFL